MYNPLNYLKITIVVLIIGIFIYLKSQVSFFKNAYEKEVIKYNDYVSVQKDAYNVLNNKYKDLTIQYNNKVIEAQENAKKQKEILTTTIANNNKLVNSLHNQISNNKSNLSNYSRDTLIKYSDTYAEVFGQCTTRLNKLAEEADYHAIDLQTCRSSWPKNVESKNENTNN